MPTSQSTRRDALERELRVFRERETSPQRLLERKLDAIERYLRPDYADRAALLVIDMQRGFLERGSPLEVPRGRTVCIKKVSRLLRESRKKNGVHRIFTKYVHPTMGRELIAFPFTPEVFPRRNGNAPTGFSYPSDCCAEGDPSCEIVKELSPERDEIVIEKHGYDAFFDTPLNSVLLGLNVRYLYVCGVMTDICVDSTIRSALHQGYKVTAISDAVATLSSSVQRAFLDTWKRKFARVKTTDDAIEEILRLPSSRRAAGR